MRTRLEREKRQQPERLRARCRLDRRAIGRLQGDIAAQPESEQREPFRELEGREDTAD
jgi:hypothetical protein